MRRIAARIGGFPLNSVGEMADIPMTAHFLGGCVIGDSPGSGVIDPYQRLYGHPGLHVVDGSAISANLGVNPALTITAQAERAMALWPNKDESDPRPPLSTAYRRVTPAAPRHPAVPPSAPRRCGCRSPGSAKGPRIPAHVAGPPVSHLRRRTGGGPRARRPTRCSFLLIAGCVASSARAGAARSPSHPGQSSLLLGPSALHQQPGVHHAGLDNHGRTAG